LQFDVNKLSKVCHILCLLQRDKARGS
jgi:hypothetical protein